MEVVELDLKKLTVEALEDLQQSIMAEVERRHQEAITEAVQKVKELADAAAIPVEDLLELVKAENSRSKGAQRAKYKDPSSGATWTGKGRKPGWVVSFLEAGGVLEDLAI